MNLSFFGNGVLTVVTPPFRVGLQMTEDANPQPIITSTDLREPETKTILHTFELGDVGFEDMSRNDLLMYSTLCFCEIVRLYGEAVRNKESLVIEMPILIEKVKKHTDSLDANVVFEMRTEAINSFKKHLE